MDSEIFTGTVSGIASEGQGIVKHDGLVTFIPFTAPGDTIRFTITQKKRNFAIGHLEEVVVPSPQRTTPLCPYFGTCGGCQLQHLRYDAQLAAKRQWIEDALQRIAGLHEMKVPAVTPSHMQWSYRRRINLVLKSREGAYQAGYTGVDNRTLVSVAQCPIFASPDDPIVASVQEIAHKLTPAGPEDGRATILKRHQGGYIVHFHFKKMPDNIDPVITHSLQHKPFIAGILASSAKKSLKFGIVDNFIDVDGLHIDFSPKAFIQSHPEQSLNIYRAIVAKAQELQPKKALDLYSGIGISSLLLAREGIHVTGIESNPDAVSLAVANGKKNKIANAHFMAADVAAVLDGQLAKNPDFVVVNPPREGLAPAVLKALEAHPVKTLIYVSCMPSTLARDLKQLPSYSVDSIQAFDMFPQTYHVETMVILHLLD